MDTEQPTDYFNPQHTRTEIDGNLTAESIGQFAVKHQTELARGIVRHWYWELKEMTQSDRAQNPRNQDYSATIRKDRAHPNTAKVLLFLGDDTSDRWERSGQLRLEFRFSVSQEIARAYQNHQDLFLSIDEFELDNVILTARDHSEFSLDSNTPWSELNQSFSDLNINSQTFKTHLDWIMQPEEDYSHSRAEIESLAKETGLTNVETDLLANAITEFGNFYELEVSNRDPLRTIGRCLTVPTEFRQFCLQKFGVMIDLGEYGGGESYDGRPKEVHQVNLYKGIVIDWTYRQFEKVLEKPYPFIYSVEKGKEKGLRINKDLTTALLTHGQQHDTYELRGRDQE